MTIDLHARSTGSHGSFAIFSTETAFRWRLHIKVDSDRSVLAGLQHQLSSPKRKENDTTKDTKETLNMSDAAPSSKIRYAISGNNQSQIVTANSEAVYDTREEALDQCGAYLAAKVRQFYGLRPNAVVNLGRNNRWTYDREEGDGLLKVSFETPHGWREGMEVRECELDEDSKED